MRSAREYADKLENTLRFGRDIAGFDFVDTMHNLIECAMSEAYEAGQREKHTHIYCEICGISPVLYHHMYGNDISGKFTDATDIQCDECKLVIATLYNPIKPYGDHNG